MPTPWNNIAPGESWKSTILAEAADKPDEIVPGLYLSNAKTAAAYLLDDIEKGYPIISCIVTILNEDYDDTGLPPFPKPSSKGMNIKRLAISKQDWTDVNLLEDFDLIGAFINEGVRAYEEYTKSIQNTTKIARAERKANEAVVRSIENMSLSEVAQPLLLPGQDLAPFGSAAWAQQKRRPVTGGVLVHCHAGISRSSTIVIAYLLKYQPQLFTTKDSRSKSSRLFKPIPIQPTADKKDKVDKAISFVRSKRSVVDPNDGFVAQLHLYHDELNCSITDPATGKLKPEYTDRERSGEITSALNAVRLRHLREAQMSIEANNNFHNKL